MTHGAPGLGLITEIQHGSTHDGPGVRTTVFLKGCNMRCRWCHNPETVHPSPEILFSPEKCIGCGQCEKGCYAGAKEICGRTVSVEEVLTEILQDKPYYKETGGVTVTGGEPLCQADFTAALLSACQAEGIGTAIESNLNFPWTQVENALCSCDLLMCDIKAFTPALHKAVTGAGNEKVLENIKKTPNLSIPVIVRTPVVCGVNANENEILAIASFLAELPNLLYYELLSYHPLGMGKGKSQYFTPEIFKAPAAADMKKLGAIAAASGIPVRINGITFSV